MPWRLAEQHRPHGAVFGRRRFPLAGRSRAAQGRARHRRVDDLHAAADGGRRIAPAGRHLPRHRRTAVEDRPRSGRARRREPRERARQREPRQHTPQFLQRSAAPHARMPAPAPRTTTNLTRNSATCDAGGVTSPARDCPLCPRSRHSAKLAEARARLVQRAGALFGPRRGAPPHRRPGAGTARRQPHRPAVHRRLCRRSPLRDAAGVSDSRRATTTPPGRRLELVDARITNAVRCVPPRKQADAGGDRHLPAISRSPKSPQCRISRRWSCSAVSPMTAFAARSASSFPPRHFRTAPGTDHRGRGDTRHVHRPRRPGVHAALGAGRLHRHVRDRGASPRRSGRCRSPSSCSCCAPSASRSCCARRSSACGCVQSARTRSRRGASAFRSTGPRSSATSAPRSSRSSARSCCSRSSASATRARAPGYTLTSITAVVLGGTSLLGGRGTFIGTLMGAGLSVQVLNATVFLSLDQKWQYIFQGFLIVAAALIYSQVRAGGRAPRPPLSSAATGAQEVLSPPVMPRKSTPPKVTQATSPRCSGPGFAPSASAVGSACASSRGGSSSRRARSRRSRRARCSPPCARCTRFVSEFGVTVDEVLFDQEPLPDGASAARPSPAVAGRGSRVQRAEGRPTITLNSGVTWERLMFWADEDVEFIEATYPPGGASGPDDALGRHSGHEFGYILSGTLRVVVGFDEFDPRAGRLDHLPVVDAPPAQQRGQRDGASHLGRPRPARGATGARGRS